MARRGGVVWLRRRALLGWYRLRRTRPVDPNLALFDSYWGRGVGDNPAAIYDSARQLVPGLVPVWQVRGDRVQSLPAGTQHVVVGSARYYDVLARASVFVTNVNFSDDLVKRPGTVHVQTHHGTPLKCMGFDLQGKAVPGGDVDFDGMLKRCARWDLSVSSNSYSTEIWRRAFPGNYASVDIGYPRNDPLVNPDPARVAGSREALSLGPDHKVLLYAPTFRDNEASFTDRLSLPDLAEELGSEWVILARLHHFYDSGLPASAQPANVLDVTAHPSITDLFLAADVLCTDYSSVMFDFANLGRPIVIYAPDWEDYAATRGVYFDLLAAPPGPVARTQAELTQNLIREDYRSTESGQQLAAFRAKFCEFETGHASADAVQLIWSRVSGQRAVESSDVR
jgi:CDP-glycerol glycerophosphotransferase